MSICYSVVIPFKNEEENVVELILELEPVMNSLNSPWELICIDDGSTDRTKAILLDLAAKRPYMRVIVFSKNFGQSSAFDAGFKAAKGEFVITMDGDRQNDPHDIPKLVEAIKGHDLVCGFRRKRRDPWLKRSCSRLANFVRKRCCADGMQDTGCSLKIYRTESLRKIKIYQGMHRFLPALFVIEGCRIREIPVHHRARVKGKTKYNLFNRNWNTIMDMLAVWWMRSRHLHYKIEEHRER